MIVELMSKDFGSDYYNYETHDEVLAAVSRLMWSCKEHYDKDGIGRVILVHVNEGHGEPTKASGCWPFEE